MKIAAPTTGRPSLSITRPETGGCLSITTSTPSASGPTGADAGATHGESGSPRNHIVTSLIHLQAEGPFGIGEMLEGRLDECRGVDGDPRVNDRRFKFRNRTILAGYHGPADA